MSTKSRRKSFSVIDRLIREPGQFCFTQAVRLLERASTYRNFGAGENRNTRTIGRFAPAERESIRFESNSSLSFPESDIQLIKDEPQAYKPSTWRVLVNFIGLNGAMGILPFHYSELAIQRLRKKDASFVRFLNLFNHRITSLFYQASIKYRLPLQYETQRLEREKRQSLNVKSDNHTLAILSLLGLSSGHLTNRQSLHDESLIFYSGLLCQRVKTAKGLKQILQHYFQVPIQVNEFVGQWQPLIDDVRTRLPGPGLPLGQNSRLGQTSMLGSQGWFAQGKLQIIVGPLSQQAHRQFAPGSRSCNALNELSRFYLGMEYDFEFVIKVNRSNLQDKVVLNPKAPPIMGWSTWLSDSRPESSETAVLDIKISSSC